MVYLQFFGAQHICKMLRSHVDKSSTQKPSPYFHGCNSTPFKMYLIWIINFATTPRSWPLVQALRGHSRWDGTPALHDVFRSAAAATTATAASVPQLLLLLVLLLLLLLPYAPSSLSTAINCFNNTPLVLLFWLTGLTARL